MMINSVEQTSFVSLVPESIEDEYSNLKNLLFSKKHIRNYLRDLVS